MWSDLGTMQASGVKVEAMLGGAAAGSYANLATDFSEYYPLLKNLITEHHLDGIDLDVEESESLGSIEQLINQLRADFGSSFLITMAPVASALEGGGNISGFSYDDLVHADGSAINWYNAQFYCGWGSLSTTANYDAIINYGLVPASKLVAGAVTNPSSCSGYVAPATLEKTVKKLVAEHPDFGGVAGSELKSCIVYWMKPRLSATRSYRRRAVSLVSCVCQYTRAQPRARAHFSISVISARATPRPRTSGAVNRSWRKHTSADVVLGWVRKCAMPTSLPSSRAPSPLIRSAASNRCQACS
jgi:hypothetical protein